MAVEKRGWEKSGSYVEEDGKDKFDGQGDMKYSKRVGWEEKL